MKLSMFYFLIILSYCLGSISSAVVVCRLLKLPDPRRAGSKNPGATNVLRLAGKVPALVVLLGDILKGIIPVCLARLVGIDGMALAILVVIAVLGHMFPLFFNFKGGKGVATALGGIFALSFLIGLMTLLTWVLIAAVTRYSSLASIVALVMACFYNGWWGNTHYFIPLLILCVVIVLRHHRNIRRLIDGTESKLGEKLVVMNKG